MIEEQNFKIAFIPISHTIEDFSLKALVNRNNLSKLLFSQWMECIASLSKYFQANHYESRFFNYSKIAHKEKPYTIKHSCYECLKQVFSFFINKT